MSRTYFQAYGLVLLFICLFGKLFAVDPFELPVSRNTLEIYFTPSGTDLSPHIPAFIADEESPDHVPAEGRLGEMVDLPDYDGITRVGIICNANDDEPLARIKRAGLACERAGDVKSVRLFAVDCTLTCNLSIFDTVLEHWEGIKTVELYNLGYPFSKLILDLFKDLQSLHISNENGPALTDYECFSLKKFKNLSWLKLSNDPYLTVDSYSPLVQKTPIGAHKLYTIQAPLFAGLSGNAIERKVSEMHPLLNDNKRDVNDFERSIHTLFMTLPPSHEYPAIQYQAGNYIIAIDFKDLPVTTAFLEILLQTAPAKASGKSAGSIDPVIWGNKFLNLAFLNISHTHVDRLPFTTEFKKLEVLVLSRAQYQLLTPEMKGRGIDIIVDRPAAGGRGSTTPSRRSGAITSQI